MLPNQASAPLKRLLRPCLRLYQSNSPLSGLPGTFSALELQAHAPTLPSFAPVTLTLMSNSSPVLAHPPNVKSFTTSCACCEKAKEQTEEALNKSLKFENGEKTQAILNASFEELKTMAPKVESGFQSCLVLQRLSVLRKEGQTPTSDGESLLQDAWLNKVSQMIDQQVMRISPKVLVATLRSLYEMTDSDVYIIKSLITQVLWLLRRLPMALLVQVLQLHLSHQESGLRESVVRQSMTALERRWVELTSIKDIIFLMYTMQAGEMASQSLMERLEDRALDMVEHATPKELFRILYLLSRQRHRNTPLIRAAVYHLNKTSLSSLSAVQLNNLVFALCTLSVYDVPLLGKVSAELATKQADLTPKLAASLLMSFSRLRWKDGSALQIILGAIDGQAQESSSASDSGSGLHALDAVDKAGVVYSLANLNLDSAQSRAVLEKVVRSPEIKLLQESSPLHWLDIVWSLSVFRMLDAESAASVLTEDFWGSLPGSDSFQSMVNLIKVSNINMAASLELEGYTGPFLPPTISTADAKLLQKGERKVTEKVVSALANFAPLESYTLTNNTAPGGYLIDAEFYVDCTGNPKPLSQTKQAPSDGHRVALKVLEFPDLTLPTSDPSGLHAMAARHLRQQGYLLVEVYHTEVAGKSKVVELVQFLQQKVKDALKVKDTAKVNNSPFSDS